MIVIKNIILKDLIEVLNSMPKNTKFVRIEYTSHNAKMVVYPSEDEGSITRTDDDPHISPDEDITDYI